MRSSQQPLRFKIAQLQARRPPRPHSSRPHTHAHMSHVTCRTSIESVTQVAEKSPQRSDRIGGAAPVGVVIAASNLILRATITPNARPLHAEPARGHLSPNSIHKCTYTNTRHTRDNPPVHAVPHGSKRGQLGQQVQSRELLSAAAAPPFALTRERCTHLGHRLGNGFRVVLKCCRQTLFNTPCVNTRSQLHGTCNTRC